MDWTSTEDAQEIHHRTYPLLYTLNSMNANQGLGFVMFTKVVDKKTLNVIFISLLSFFSTVVPLFYSLLPNAETTMASITTNTAQECNATAIQIATVRAAFLGSECVPVNETIGSMLAGH